MDPIVALQDGEFYEVVCYGKDGAAFHKIIAPTMDTVELMALIPEETFGIHIHDAKTGKFIGRQ